MIVSPTEPAKLRDAATRVSMTPEHYGADVLIIRRGLKIGVQRKELKDLIASMGDGRLGQQLAQMDALDVKVLVVEGRVNWSTDGQLVLPGRAYGGAKRFTKAQFQGCMWSVMNRGVWVDYTRDVDDTVEWLGMFERWVGKDRHDSLVKREKVVGSWGTVNNRDYQRHLLMGLPGVGVELADRIIDTVGMPFGWTVGREQLMGVEGLGKKKVDKLMGVFGETDRN